MHYSLRLQIRQLLYKSLNEENESFDNLNQLIIKKFPEIEGRFLNAKQAEELQKEIESHYMTNDKFLKVNQNNDIRMSMWNYDYPVAQKKINGIDLRITEGLIRNRRKTYLLYADGKIIGEFYSVPAIKMLIKYIETHLIKTLPQFKLN